MRKTAVLDIIISLLCSFVMNSFVIYYFLRYGEPIYFHYDEIIWVKQAGFCGGEYPFYEQRWGLVIPALCVIYPLKFLIEPYYFSLLRPFIIFLDCFLFLRLLRIIFRSNAAIYFVFFFHFSNIFSLLRFFSGNFDHVLVLSNIYGNTLRIFNPSYFEIFFLLFCIFFVRFLRDLERGLVSGKWKFLSGIFLGLVFYTLVFWWEYAFLSVFMMLIYLWRKGYFREVLQVLLIGLLVGFPAIVFNIIQAGFVGEAVKRGFMLVRGERVFPAIPKDYMFFLFLGVISFLVSGVFTLRGIFVLVSVLVAFILFFQEFITGIHSQLSVHITVPFKIFTKIAMGFLVERIWLLVHERREFLGHLFERLVISVMAAGFFLNWANFFYFMRLKGFSPEYTEIFHWVKENTSNDSVIVFEDSYGFFPLFDVFPTSSELMISVATGRYILHSNINYFSNFSDEEVFERFMLRSRLLGYTKDELRQYIANLSKRKVVWSGWSSLWISRAYFGVPEGFDMLRYGSFQEAVNDFTKYALRFYDEALGYMRKYKVDYVIRRKPKADNETYLSEITKIGKFYIFEVLK